MRRPHRGDWSPLIPPRYRWPIVLLLVLTPFVAGIDFLMGENSSALSVVEKSAPSWAWGTALVAAGALSVGGYLMRWARTCIAGLHATGVLFALLSIGVGVTQIDELGGFRGPWVYMVVAVSAWLAALGYADQLKGRGAPDER